MSHTVSPSLTLRQSKPMQHKTSTLPPDDSKNFPIKSSFFKFSWKKALVCVIGLSLLVSAPLYALQDSHPDNLSTLPWWNAQISWQAEQNRNQNYSVCLFGDSISSGLGQTLGQSNVNFGTGGLSTVSLITQLKTLKSAQVGCQYSIVAIGTNDAMYTIEDAEFVENLREALRLVKSLGSQQIILIPAFYSTLKASLNPMMAGPLSRVDEINRLIDKVSTEEGIPTAFQGLEVLYENNSLRSDVTFDGVHLNETGKTIYRSFIKQMFP